MCDEFRLTAEHLELLRHANIDMNGGQYGAPGMDEKRPYGNSNVDRDIVDILGWAYDEELDNYAESKACSELSEKAWKFHGEMATALQLICCHAGKELRPGLYRRMKLYDDGSWERVSD